MKRIISFILAFTVVLGCFGAVFADEELEKITLLVKQRVSVPAEYTEFYTETRWNKNYGQIVSFEWKTEDGEFINVCATMSGIITDYYSSEGEINRGISKISAQEGVELANAFMQKINPDIASEYVFERDEVNLSYGISGHTDRVVGTARVEGDYASISMDNETGEVVSFYLNHTEYDFEKEEGVISYDAAKAKFSDKTELTICYMDGKDGEIVPVYIDYRKKYEDVYGVDAFTGEYVNYERKYRSGIGNITMNEAMGNMKEDSAADAMLTDKELEDLSKYNNYISKEDAEKKLKEIEELGIKDFSLRSASYNKKYVQKDNERQEDGMTLSMNFFKDGSYANVKLDAETGEILSFNQTEKSENKVKITKDEAEKIADGFMEKLTEKKYMKATSIEEDGISRNIYFEEVETVPYINNETTVSVDLSTGFISNYYNGFDDYDKDKVVDWSQAIANAMAHKVYINSSKYELVQTDIYGSDAMPLYGIEMKENDEKVYKLLYRVKEKPYAIDAITGNPCKAGGEAYEEEEKSFRDIKGHWCETAVNSLVENGFLKVEEEMFNPNEAITVKDAQNMLEMASLYRYDIKNEEEPLSREEAIKAIICGAGYEKVGKLSEIYLPVFGDWESITEENRGFVALGKGFGIISGDQNGNFNPDTLTTKASFAVMIYNYILSGSPSF